MSTHDDRWLWFIDDAPLQALLKAEGELGTMRMRAASSPALVGAMTAHMEGRTAAAADGLRDAIAAGESQPEAFLFLGQIYFESKQFEDALAIYRRLLALDPDHAAAAFNAGVCQERLLQWGAAADHFRRSVQSEPGRPEAWLGLGLACLHQRKAEEALAGFDRFLQFEPENEPALFGRAVALQMLRRYDEAAVIYDRFRSLGEPSPELLTNLLAVAVARKDTGALASVCQELTRLRPGSRQTAEAQAYSALIAGDWASAVAYLADLADTEPLPEDWAYARAYAVWRCGHLEESLHLLDTLLRVRPSHNAGQLLRGAVLEALGRAEDALTAFRTCGRQSPDSDAAWWSLARLAASSGNAVACLEAAKSLLNRNRRSPEGWFATGLAALLEGRGPDAVNAFSEVLRLRRDWPEAEWNLGLAFLEADEPGKAQQKLELVYGALRDQVSAVPLARAILENGEPGRALDVLESADALNDSPDLTFNLAVAFHESADLETAERLYRHLVDAGTPFADAHVNLGHVLLAAGRPGDAEQFWRQAKEMELAA